MQKFAIGHQNLLDRSLQLGQSTNPRPTLLKNKRYNTLSTVQHEKLYKSVTRAKRGERYVSFTQGQWPTAPVNRTPCVEDGISAALETEVGTKAAIQQSFTTHPIRGTNICSKSYIWGVMKANDTDFLYTVPFFNIFLWKESNKRFPRYETNVGHCTREGLVHSLQVFPHLTVQSQCSTNFWAEKRASVSIDRCDIQSHMFWGYCGFCQLDHDAQKQYLNIAQGHLQRPTRIQQAVRKQRAPLRYRSCAFKPQSNQQISTFRGTMPSTLL